MGNEYTSDRVWFVNEQAKLGFLDKRGNEAIPAQFDYVSRPYGNYHGFYTDGYAVVGAEGKRGIIDENGNYLVAAQLDDIAYFDVDLYE